MQATGRQFWKMHGCGNDFVVIDARIEPFDPSPAEIAALADRRTGIGFDQLVVLEPPRHAAAAVFLRLANADGSSAGACGNAARCVALLLNDAHPDPTLETQAGLMPTRRLGPTRVAVDMGPPALDWRSIPLAREADTRALPLTGRPAACSMGNPHLTLFGTPLANAETLGPALERDPLLPDRANIGFAQVLAPDRIRLRVWERGAGATRACGSGACAALVNAHRLGLTDRRASLDMDGGTLEIAWRDDGTVEMTGEAALSFAGTLPPLPHSQPP